MITFSATQLALSLARNFPYHPLPDLPPIQIGVGAPPTEIDKPNSSVIHIAANDDFDLGDVIDTNPKFTLLNNGDFVQTDDRFVWAGGKVHKIDGGGGTNNTLVIDLDWLKQGYSWTTSGDHVDLYRTTDVLLSVNPILGTTVVPGEKILVGSLYRIQSVEFDVNGLPQEIANLSDLSKDPHGEILWDGFKWRALDGYIWGGTIFADTNKNGKLDPDEVSAITDSSGSFTLTGGSGRPRRDQGLMR